MVESCTVTAMQNAAANHIVETVKPSQSMSLCVHTASKLGDGPNICIICLSVVSLGSQDVKPLVYTIASHLHGERGNKVG